MKKSIIYTYIILQSSLLFSLSLAAQTEEWIVPDDKKEMVSSFTFTPDIQKSGEALYQRNCQSCHGEPTKANYAALNPIPGDPASEKFQQNTDGEMFYKITEGKGLMPQFRNSLTEKERWDIIAYLRTFNKNYIQPALAKAEEFKGDKVNLDLLFDEKTKQITAKLSGLVNEKEEPVKKADLDLYVKRYFGKMQIGESAKTNDEGIASFIYPEDLPGNDSGYVELIVKVKDASQFGEVEKRAFVNIGIPKNMKKLTDQRAMWNISKKAPLWLIFSYFGVVLLVWSVIIYILFQLYKLWKIGQA